MALYGYARVSTADQDFTVQEHALRAAGCRAKSAQIAFIDRQLDLSAGASESRRVKCEVKKQPQS